MIRWHLHQGSLLVHGQQVGSSRISLKLMPFPHFDICSTAQHHGRASSLLPPAPIRARPLAPVALRPGSSGWHPRCRHDSRPVCGLGGGGGVRAVGPRQVARRLASGRSLAPDPSWDRVALESLGPRCPSEIFALRLGWPQAARHQGPNGREDFRHGSGTPNRTARGSAARA